MSLIKRYIAREFIGFFLICSLSLLVIAVVFATLAELPTLEKENGVELFKHAILSGIPLLIEVIVPISVLLATVLAFISLSRTSEIIAMMAAGASLFHLILPVLYSGVVIAFLLYLNQSFLAPHWGADERAGLVDTARPTDVWRFYEDGIYFFQSPDKQNKTIPNSRTFRFDSDYTIKTTGFSRDLKRDADSWQIGQSKRIDLRFNAVTITQNDSYTVSIEDFPVVFTKDILNPKYTGFSDLISEIGIKMRGAVNYRQDLFALYQKVAGLTSIFVMILLALPFSIYSGRAANVRTGIVISVVLGFVFWLIDQIMLSFNSTGLLPMEISAFGANVLFLGLALILIRRKRT